MRAAAVLGRPDPASSVTRSEDAQLMPDEVSDVERERASVEVEPARIARAKPFKAFLVIAVAACIARVLISQYVFRDFVDDAYIYLRYCDNWDAGIGLVYNAGERVIAFTSYLYVFAIAALDKVAFGLAPTTVVKIFNTVVFAIFCAILWRLLDQSRFLYWATAIFLFFYFPFIDATVSGMETTLFLAIIAGAMVAVRESRFELAVALSAVAVVTRPEGALLLIAVCAVAFGRLAARARARGRVGGWHRCGCPGADLPLLRHGATSFDACQVRSSNRVELGGHTD